MLYIFLSISILINIVLLVCVYKSLSVIDKLENWIIEFKYLIENLYIEMKQLDNKNMFEKDDEVGSLFRQITTIISNVKKVIVDEEKLD